MSLKLYAHPFSSYSQKVLIALYENATPFEFILLDSEQPFAELEAVWPFRKFPVLFDGEHTVRESSVIIEYLGLHFPGPVKLLPKVPDACLEVRFMDRFFDNYVMTPMQKIVGDALRPVDKRDLHGVEEARKMLDVAYGWLDDHMAHREWAAADVFSLADCAAAPALFYADWAHAIADRFKHTKAYRNRLLARASIVRAVDEARPYRSFFPLGAPERD